MNCIHDHRFRFTTGYYCEDCREFFNKESAVYRATEMLSSIWMVLNNINVALLRAGKNKDAAVAAMKDKIGIGKSHENYDDLISEIEELQDDD